MNYRYDNAYIKYQEDNEPYKAHQIRRLLNIRSKTIRPLSQSSPLRAELEVETFGRQFFVERALSTTISLPLVMFIDDFGVYRNMHRTLTGVYMSLAGMSQKMRNRRVNVFPLTLGPHGSKIGDVLAAIVNLQVLDKGTDILLYGEQVWASAFVHCFTGNMPQQNKNSGMKNQNANRGCRYCFVPAKERYNLEYDIITNGRYHHTMVDFRRVMQPKLNDTQWKALCQEQGLDEEPVPNPLLRITRALDTQRTRVADIGHSDLGGLGKKEHQVLLDTLLKKECHTEYAVELRRFPFPPGWGRIQSPVRHLKSWNMQEAGRATVITPLLLRCWLQRRHVDDDYWDAVGEVFRAEMERLKLEEIGMLVWAFSAMARSNCLTMATQFNLAGREKLLRVVYEGRKAFQGLCEVAVRAAKEKGRRAAEAKALRDAERARKTAAAAQRAGHPPPHSGSPSSSSSIAAPLSQRAASQERMPTPSESAAQERHETPADDRRQERLTGTKAAAEFTRYQSLPNVHQGLHLAEVAYEYGTASNVLTFIGEDFNR